MIIDDASDAMMRWVWFHVIDDASVAKAIQVGLTVLKYISNLNCMSAIKLYDGVVICNHTNSIADKSIQ